MYKFLDFEEMRQPTTYRDRSLDRGRLPIFHVTLPAHQTTISTRAATMPYSDLCYQCTTEWCRSQHPIPLVITHML